MERSDELTELRALLGRLPLFSGVAPRYSISRCLGCAFTRCRQGRLSCGKATQGENSS